jgi:hypothetical protein
MPSLSTCPRVALMNALPVRAMPRFGALGVRSPARSSSHLLQPTATGCNRLPTTALAAEQPWYSCASPRCPPAPHPARRTRVARHSTRAVLTSPLSSARGDASCRQRVRRCPPRPSHLRAAALALAAASAAAATSSACHRWQQQHIAQSECAVSEESAVAAPAQAVNAPSARRV